ncbi:sugar transferase [Geobacter sp. FeAm09]|uniref:sugar transferase n=1 Tax=Geobacter sp. FeAm09 TaxID=2597769 RepID=UPI0011EC0D07|nr:sugar transferase [Geobacter sp. FeAm09]QEM66873.1 sugar transferase [Geobacter sp. FeAm09]
MLKQQAQLFTKLAAVADTAAIITAFVLAYNLIQQFDGRLGNFHKYSWVLMVIVPVWLFLLAHSGLYASMRTKALSKTFGSLVKVHIIGVVITASCIYLIDPKGFSRLLLGSFAIISLVLIVTVKGSIKLLLHYLRRKGYNVRHILIVGSGDKVFRFISLCRRHAAWGLVISGVVRFCGEADDKDVQGCTNLGNVNDLIDICKQNQVDEVVFSLPREHLDEVDDYLGPLQEMGITVRMVIDLYDAPTSIKELSMFHNEIPMLTYYSKAFDASQLFLKRCLDIFGSLVGLLITGVLLPFIALAIRLDSPGPLFFGQKRVGKNGRTFRCWKFRSMTVDAEEHKNELLDCNEMHGAMFKMENDPRVTRVGRFIRKTSIDELPQFWNVFKGEMSLVGTRPPTPDEVATYENWQRKRICIKPGITGLWQVSGRNQIQDFDEVVRLDIRYIEQWSLWLDIKLLFKTIWVVIAGRGAR